MRYTQRQPTAFRPGGSSHSSQTPCSRSALYSCWEASCQRPASSQLIASLYVLGSAPEVRKAYSMSSEAESARTLLASSRAAISASAADSELLPLCLERLCCCSLAYWYGWLTFHHSPVGR